jgi:hypothetical protein
MSTYDSSGISYQAALETVVDTSFITFDPVLRSVSIFNSDVSKVGTYGLKIIGAISSSTTPRSAFVIIKITITQVSFCMLTSLEPDPLD